MMKQAVFFSSIVAIVLVAITTGFNLAQSIKYQSDNATPLRTILYGNNCSAPCWQHIASGLSDAEQVRQMLDGVVDYQTLNRLTGEIHTIGWWSNDTRFRPEEAGGVMVVFTEEATVLRVVIWMDVCISTILREYGEPVRVEPDGQYEYQLQYPDEGSFFIIGRADATKTIYMVYTVQSEFSRTANGLSWEEAENIFAGECVDSFSA